MQRVNEEATRLLLGVKGEVCSEKAQNQLDGVSIVRDVRLSGHLHRSRLSSECITVLAEIFVTDEIE
jgi:hypothetical protein